MRFDTDGRAGRRRAPRRQMASAVAALTVCVPLAGCGLLSSGVTISTTAVMTVTESEFPANVMPRQFTCAGGTDPASPPISWAGAPPGTKSIALVVDDANAPITPYVYWVVFDIGPGTSALSEGQLPPGARQARGTAGYDHYDPPCPGSGGHGYRFTVYALNKVLKLPNGASLESAWQAIAAATIGWGRLAVTATS